MVRCGEGYTAAKTVIDGVEAMVCRAMTADEAHKQKRDLALILGITLPILALLACFCFCCTPEQSHARAVKRAEAEMNKATRDKAAARQAAESAAGLHTVEVV